MIKWYLTPYNDPTRKIEGPFPTRQEAYKRAAQRLSDETREYTKYTLTMPAMLIPTPMQYKQSEPVYLQPWASQHVNSNQGTNSTSGAYSSTSTRVTPSLKKEHFQTPTRRARASHAARVVSDTINKLDKLKLQFLAHQLNIPLPDHASKNEIIDIIRKDLES